jgi:hypothetical protein
VLVKSDTLELTSKIDGSRVMSRVVIASNDSSILADEVSVASVRNSSRGRRQTLQVRRREHSEVTEAHLGTESLTNRDR